MCHHHLWTVAAIPDTDPEHPSQKLANSEGSIEVIELRNIRFNIAKCSPPARAGTSMSVRLLLPLTRVHKVVTAVIAGPTEQFARKAWSVMAEIFLCFQNVASLMSVCALWYQCGLPDIRMRSV